MRKILLSLLAILVIAPALAQMRVPVFGTSPRVMNPMVKPVPVVPRNDAQTAPQVNTLAIVSADPEKAAALITKLRNDKKVMRSQLQSTVLELQQARTTIDEMTRVGGSLVRAQCASDTLSRATSGGEENCAASGYRCGGSEGTCYRQCSTSSQCAPGFLCDVGEKRCVTPPPPSNDDDDGWWPW